MSVADDPRTLGQARLSFASVEEIDEFVTTLERFERGEITPDQWRQFRLVRGTYGQRQPDVQMLRVKIPQGVLTSAQLEALADVAARHSRGFGHVTTRQNMQFHFVPLHDVEAAMRRLAEAGLTTREACGNSVRNITACPLAGVAADEPFDVTPYAESLTRYLLRHPLSSTLPRKFKIAFEGCAVDHVATAINDLGFRARVDPDGTRGFFVTAGGGTSTMATGGTVLHDFLPAPDLFLVAESVLRVFHRFGDYEHKQRNRMKFLIKALGWAGFRDEYWRAREALGDAVPQCSIDPSIHEQEPAVPTAVPSSPTDIAARLVNERVDGPGLTPPLVPILQTTDEAFGAWRATNVRPQKQTGFASVTATVRLGDLTAQQMRVLGELADAYGDGTVRTSSDQNVLFRWVKKMDVRQVYRRLAAAGLGDPGAGTLADVASCPGAESCRLAVTQARGLGRLLENTLRARPDLVGQASSARIKISGCPNGCGQHHLATIGFQGSVRRINGRPVPQYFVMVGGDVSGPDARFARLAAKVPARRLPAAVERLISLYTAERLEGEDAAAFFARVDASHVHDALRDLETLREGDASPEDFDDLGEAAMYAPEVLDGECAS